MEKKWVMSKVQKDWIVSKIATIPWNVGWKQTQSSGTIASTVAIINKPMVWGNRPMRTIKK